MEYKIFSEQNIRDVIPLYIHYYNETENCEWTEVTAYKRIHQMFSTEDSFGLVVTDNNEVIGFALGYFQQYDDGITYNLTEIVISTEYQRQGIGTNLIKELETQVENMGAFMIALEAVNDDNHDKFYSRLDYHNVNNMILKCKML